MENLIQFLFSIIYTIPFLLIYLAGIVFSLTNYGKMPKAARLSLIGCSLLSINSLIHILSTAWTIFWFYSSGTGKDTRFLSTVMSITAAFATLFGVAGFIFLLAAIFAKRDNPPQI